MSEAIEVLNTEEIEALSIDVLQGANALVIKGEDDLKLASFVLGGIGDLLAEAERLYRPNIKRWDHGHRAAIKELNVFIGPLVSAQRKVKGQVADHHNDIRIAAERARRKAEAEERAREEERRLAAAVQLEEAGHEEAAEVLLETPAPIAKPMISTPPPPKTAGMGIGTKRTAKVFSLWKLVTFVVLNEGYLFTLLPDQKRLDSLAREAKDKSDGYELLPGVTLVVEATVSSKRRRP
jgi:hypothetical protein